VPAELTLAGIDQIVEEFALAARVRAQAGIPVAAVGMITEPDQAAKILANAEPTRS
jgi:2,4-dienoyl-CoA reductase-like NADH-dependent reductase (Old Yellow Enzyme family)